jgi:putative ABC transport system permease protein
MSAPLRRGGFLDVQFEDPSTFTGAPTPKGGYKSADPNYFAVAGIPLLKGRAFQETDNEAAPLVVIVSNSFAKKYFGDNDPIGKRIAWTASSRFIPNATSWRTIVGIVGDTRDAGLETEPTPTVYQAFAQSGITPVSLIVATKSDPVPLEHLIVQSIRDAAPGQAVTGVKTLEEMRDAAVLPRRLNAMFVASFAGLAFLIAIVGIAGVLASSVRSRTSELGIRMSLGAAPERLRRMVLAEGGILIALGIGIGAGGSILTGRLLRGLLFGVAPNDPTTFGIAALLLAGVGIAACSGPAARAARIDPAVALRAD